MTIENKLSLNIKNVKYLDADDIQLICDNKKEENIILEFLNSDLEKNHNKVMIACYLGDKIMGVSMLVFAESRPWGSLVFLKINQKLSISTRLKILNLIVDNSFKQAEERNCIRIYMVNKLQKRGQFLNARLYPLVKKIERLQKYSFITEAVISANQQPRYEYESQLIGTETRAEDLGIVSATRNQYDIFI